MQITECPGGPERDENHGWTWTATAFVTRGYGFDRWNRVHPKKSGRGGLEVSFVGAGTCFAKWGQVAECLYGWIAGSESLDRC